MFLSKLKKRSLKKSNYDRVFSNLNSICDCLDYIYSINEGGCCYIAYIMADILEREGFKFDVLIIPDPEVDMPEKFSYLTGPTEHVCLRVTTNNDVYLVNCTEDFDEDDYIAYYNVSSVDILNYYKSWKWNWIYDVARNKFIKYVINLIYDNFSSSLREKRRNSTSK